MSIDTIREALNKRLRDIALTVWRVIDDGDGSDEAVDKAAALILAHDDAIRRECADRAIGYFFNVWAKGIEYDDDDLRAAILGKEGIDKTE